MLRGGLGGNPAAVGLVATLSSIISVCLQDLCFVCGQLACRMMKSGRKSETPRGGVTKDRLPFSIPPILGVSLPPSRIMAALPPSRFLASSFLFLLIPSLLRDPPGHRSVRCACREEEEGGCRDESPDRKAVRASPRQLIRTDGFISVSPPLLHPADKV